MAICLSGGNLGSLEGHEINGPAHLAAEVTSSVRERHYRTEIPSDVAADAIERLVALSITYAHPGSLATEAFRLAKDHGWAKTYDAEYVALARRLDCPLVTLDARLARGASALATIIGPTDL